MWNNIVILYTVRFISLVGLQILVFNQTEINIWIYPMIYPLFILLLPIDLNRFTVMLFALGVGLFIDFFSSTYGLHASALLIMAYFRKRVLKLLEKRDGYEPNSEPGLLLGRSWFIYYSFILLLIHHFWFFTFEYLRWDLFLHITIQSLLSTIIVTLICFIFLLLFKKNSSKQ